MKIKTSQFLLCANIGVVICGVACFARAQDVPDSAPREGEIVGLPRLAVYSSRVALQEPSAGSFAMPVSALGFEPLVDVQARNMGEAQADVTIRGGIFENTGFRVGAAPLYDPQTGHYSAEIPIAPAMLSAPRIITGADNALSGWNANAGTVASDWRRITTSGMATAAGGDYDTLRGEVYQGVARGRFAFDASAAWAESDGSLPWGESRFSRYNARAQLARESGQTDLFFGYQTKFIGWPNLYTPYANVFETDDLKTTLISLNHRENLGAITGDAGDFLATGIAWRRNEDHYVFNRADAGAYNPAFATGPSFHTTEVWSAGAQTRVSTGQIHWNASANFIADELESTSLIYGRFNTRSYFKAAFAPERTWQLDGGSGAAGGSGGRSLTARAGVVFDDTNRDGAEWSPVASLTLDGVSSALGIESVYVSYAESSQVPTYTALDSKAAAGLFRGNPNLGRESARNFEAGARATWAAWTVNATVFYRQDGDLVDWVYSARLPNARVASAVDVDTLGFEATARFAARWGELVLGYTALSKDADYPAAVGAGQVDASFYALNYARHRVTAAIVMRPVHGWEIRLDNEARWQVANALRRSGDDALLTSAGVFFTPNFAGWRGAQIFAQVTNAWDSDFEEVPSVPAARRQWSAGVMATW